MKPRTLGFRAGLLLLAAAWTGHARSQAPPFHPFYLRTQFAGSQGWLSVGAGKVFLNGRIEPDLDYGYVPEWAGGVGIHILSQTTTFSLIPTPLGPSGVLYPVSFGYSALIGLGDNYFLYGKNYTNYYWPSALHFRLFTGVKFLEKKEFLPHTCGLAGTMQVGALDSDLQAAFANRNPGFLEILSVALALNLYLGKAAH